MASTNKTTNYELSQFVETDRPAWLTDYNGDMRTIDSTMKAISDVASGASGSISELADRMSTAEGNISTNTNDIAALDARADALEAGAQSTAGTIANIQTEQTAQNLGIEAATELGYNLARPYDSASTYAVGAYVLFQNTLYKCVTAIATGEAFDPTKWLAIKATDEISAGGYTLPIASASQLGGVKVGNGLSIDPETGELSARGYTLPIASASQLGGVMVGNGLSIDPLTGILSATGGGITPNITILNNSNITLDTSGSSTTHQLISNYFSSTSSSSTPTITSPTFSLSGNSAKPSFFADFGKFAILHLDMLFKCTNGVAMSKGSAWSLTATRVAFVTNVFDIQNYSCVVPLTIATDVSSGTFHYNASETVNNFNYIYWQTLVVLTAAQQSIYEQPCRMVVLLIKNN